MLASLVPWPQEQVDFLMGLVLTKQQLCLRSGVRGCHFLLASSPRGHTSRQPVPTCNSPQPLLGALGGFEVSSGCGHAVRAVPKPCLVGICSGVMPWLCFGKALSMWEKSL